MIKDVNVHRVTFINDNNNQNNYFAIYRLLNVSYQLCVYGSTSEFRSGAMGPKLNTAQI